MSLGNGRFAHLREIAIIPLSRAISYLFVDLVGAAVTWRDLLIPDKTRQAALGLASWPHFAWGWWALLTGALCCVVIIEGSWRVATRLQGERDRAVADLAAVKTERSIRYLQAELDHATFRTGPRGLFFRSLRITLQNVGDHTIRYEMINFSVSSNGTCAKLPPFEKSWGFIAPRADIGFFSGLFEEPIKVATFPELIVLKFDLVYDTVPPTHRRAMGKTIRFRMEDSKPMRITNVFLDEREA